MTRSIVAGVVLLVAIIAGGLVSCQVIEAQNPPPYEPKIVEINGHVCTMVEKVRPNDDRYSYNTYECKETEAD